LPLSVPGPPGTPPVPVAPAGSATPPGETIRPAADVGVAKVATPDPAARGRVVTYRLRATNHGPSAATGVSVRDRLPAGMRYLSAKPAKLCGAKGRTVTCRLGELGNNRSREIALRVRLGKGVRASSLPNNISIDASEADPAAANNRDRAVASLAPRLVLRKTAGRSRARVRDTVSYTLRLTNRGPGTARNVVLCDRPRTGLVLRRAPGSRKRGRARCWNIGTLRRGRTVSRRVVASIGSGKAASRTNVATVSTGGTRAAAARAKVTVLTTPAGACPSAAWSSELRGPLANAAC
jgi:large repetitive protein